MADESEVRAVFDTYDKDKSGAIDSKEFAGAMKALGHELSPKELENLMNAMDFDGDGNVSFDEFFKAVTGEQTKAAKMQECRDAFKAIDTSGDGKISPDELKTLLTSMGTEASTEEVAAFIAEADSDGDGELDFEEFLKLLKANGMI